MQRRPSLLCLHQRERGELRQLHALLEDECGLHPAVGDERRAGDVWRCESDGRSSNKHRAAASIRAVRLSFHSDGWDWGEAEHEWSMFRRQMSTVARGFAAALANVELTDGWIELELAVGSERSFHGVVWRAVGESYESFFVRPHQAGNPDAVQYTPVTNGMSSWQLYHGKGFWAPLAFPVGEWFRLRVDFAGERAEVRVGDLSKVALVCPLKLPPRSGRIGVLVGGHDVHLGELAYGDETDVDPRPPLSPEPPAGVLTAWEVSDAFPEERIEAARGEHRSWTAIETEPGGLLDLARLQGIREGRNAVLARTTVSSSRERTAELAFGFSDRATVYLNGTPLYRGDDTYRSRDYRFLGCIGWHDRLYLPLRAGDNELVFAVAEDFGGWGLQARVVD